MGSLSISAAVTKGCASFWAGIISPTGKSDPIRFNPFYLSEGQSLDTLEKESLKSLLVSLWKQEDESFNRSEYVALSNALSGYYVYLSGYPDVFALFWAKASMSTWKTDYVRPFEGAQGERA